ncbi:NTF2-related export protein [Gryllus bimaculatus]|nr:NTF2-related export protein [Gryllus bimaculatus]
MNSGFLRREEEACTLAENFVKFYYESVDRMRHRMSRLYLDSATLIWNGNGVMGNQYIQEFFEKLPRTDHGVSTVDCQPLSQGAGLTQDFTFVLKVSGTVLLSADISKTFQQNLLITTEGDKMKIVSDCYRFLWEE